MRRIIQTFHLPSIKWTSVLALYFFASFYCNPISLYAQECVGNYTLRSQTEIDNFDCTSVSGNLRIEDSFSGNLTNLYGLSDLISIGEDLIIHDSTALTNVDGLGALVSVGRDLIFDGNRALINVDGLDALVSVGRDLIFHGNRALANVDGLGALTSVGRDLIFLLNNGLTNIDGLGALTSVPRTLKIWYAQALTNVDGLTSLASVGDIWIHGTAVTNIDGLSALGSVDGYISLVGNDVLDNVDGLSALTSVGQRIGIVDNSALTNVDGLSALISVGNELVVRQNSSLMNCCGLYPLLTVGTINGWINISGNQSGCNSVDEIVNACSSVHDNLLWQDQYNGNADSDDVANAIAILGNWVYVVGCVDNSGTGRDFAIRAYHAKTGELKWEDQCNGSADADDCATAIAVQGSRVYVAGYETNRGTGSDIVVRVYRASTGKLLWVEREDRGYNDDRANSIAVEGKRLFVGGKMRIDDYWNGNIVLTYHDRTGQLLWESSDEVSLTNVIVAQGRRLYIAGEFYELPRLLVKDIHTGRTLWLKGLGDSGTYHSMSLKKNKIYLAGWIWDLGGSIPSFEVTVYNAKTGNLQWSEVGDYEGPPDKWPGSHGEAKAITTAQNGRRVFAAGYLLTEDLQTECFAVRSYLAKTGKILWEDQFCGVGGYGYIINNANAIATIPKRVFAAGEVFNGDNSDFTIRTYHAINGNLMWQDQFNGTANGYDVANDIAVKGSRVFVVGSVSNMNKGSDFTVRAYKAK